LQPSPDGERSWEARPVLEWTPVASTRITAAAYDAEAEVIYVEFPNGRRWWYAACEKPTWDEFINPATSKGSYIHNVLDSHPNGQYDG
jgi:hypothetical protein